MLHIELALIKKMAELNFFQARAEELDILLIFRIYFHILDGQTKKPRTNCIYF